MAIQQEIVAQASSEIELGAVTAASSAREPLPLGLGRAPPTCDVVHLFLHGSVIALSPDRASRAVGRDTAFRRQRSGLPHASPENPQALAMGSVR